MSLLSFNFESQFIGNNSTVYVIMPNKKSNENSRDFFNSNNKYPVLWLLHGTFGDGTDWLRKSNIELYACERDVIVVMPSGLNSDFLNWPRFGRGFDCEKYVIDELMPFVYNWLPASNRREDNYIAGLSMGGMAAAQFGIWYPEKFGHVGMFSGFPRKWDEYLVYDCEQRTKNIIFEEGGLEKIQGSHRDCWNQLTKINKDALPEMYATIGSNDSLYEDAFIPFKKLCEQFNITCKFEIINNYGHEWRFWDICIQKALDLWNLKVVKPDLEE